MGKLLALVELARPSHWLKNLLIFAALLFSRNYSDGGKWALSVLAFLEFCLLSSGVYAWNDIFDRVRDAAHPRSAGRPIPSGRISVIEAACLGTALLAGGLALAIHMGTRPTVVAGGYLMLNILYNAVFRRHAIIDVVSIAMGFVLRAIAGGTAIGVPVSAWLIICTFMLCVFLALIKRRADVSRTDRQAAITARPASELYTVERLDHMLAVSAGSAVVTYAMYCLASPHSPGVHMVWTVPLVLYIVFRLYSLAIASPHASPVELVLRDASTWVVAIIWIALIVAIMQWSNLPELRGWITQ